MKKTGIFTFLLSMLACTAFSQADSVDTQVITEDNFSELSLEDLLNMQVTSVSKKAERLQDVASSIYVLTSEDIKNSGATNLHEALRSVPGYWATQIDYNTVTPTIRNSPSNFGLTGTVLYLLDGTPLQDNLSSVFTFENFDIPLDEIDRIEIIRGSGGAVYGANSATGVVNIFTKDPEKYDGITSRVDVATPGYANLTLRAGGKINDKLAISGYGKARFFQGFESLSEGDFITVPKTDGTGDTTIANRFTEDFASSQAYSGGLKVAYNLTDASKLSFNSHVNVGTQLEYTNFDTDLALLGVPDVLVETDVTRTRIVGNLRFDHDFNEDHSLFARVSTNIEDDFVPFFGGHDVNNSIIDFEVQDNFILGEINNFSVGANFRLVNFDINNIVDEGGVAYIDPQNTETINGIFVQDKINLLGDKLNLLLGLKAENFSVINNDYYFSPMAKVSFIPTENFTIWGGFTQSFTTPGYQLTNIDLVILKTLPETAIQGIAFQNVFDGAFQGAIDGGADEATATAIAEGFVSSAAGQATIAGAADAVRSSLPNNLGLRNGSETVPTRYQTYEVGFRATLENVVSIESNFYVSEIRDALSSSPIVLSPNEPRISGFNQNVDYFFYGNYLSGTTIGVESLVKISPSKGLQLELSHVYNESGWEFQENDDFDINDRSILSEDELDQTPETPIVPKHVLRIRGLFELPKELVFSMEVIHATEFRTASTYNFEEQRTPNIFSQDDGVEISPNQTRTIFNLKVQKNFLEEKLNVYVFGNDVFNTGIIGNRPALGSGNANLFQIGAMFGLGGSYQF